MDPENIQRMEYQKAVEKGWVIEFYPMNEYIDDIMKKINMEAIKEAHLWIVWA